MALRIDVFSDIVCPWCFIGTARLERVLGAAATEAEVLHHAFLLHPETPETGADIPTFLRRRGMDPDQAFAMLRSAAAESGLDVDFSKQRSFFPTVRAHTLLRHAAAKGTVGALHRALFEAYFTEARNIADVDVLADVALPHGFTTDEVVALTRSEDELERTREEAREASRRGITGCRSSCSGDAWRSRAPSARACSSRPSRRPPPAERRTAASLRARQLPQAVLMSLRELRFMPDSPESSAGHATSL